MPLIRAEPYEFEFDPARAGLIIIDMQRDFLEPGGFGEMLGNDVSLLQAARSSRTARCSTACAPARHAGHPHARGPPARPVRPAAGQERCAAQPRPAHRRRRPDGPHPGPRRAGHDIIPELYPLPRRAGDRQARQGRVLRHRPARDPAEPRHRAAHRHAASPPRSASTPPCARPTTAATTASCPADCVRLVLPRVPRDGPADDQGAGRHLRLGRRDSRNRRARRAALTERRRAAS